VKVFSLNTGNFIDAMKADRHLGLINYYLREDYLDDISLGILGFPNEPIKVFSLANDLNLTLQDSSPDVCRLENGELVSIDGNKIDSPYNELMISLEVDNLDANRKFFQELARFAKHMERKDPFTDEVNFTRDEQYNVGYIDIYLNVVTFKIDENRFNKDLITPREWFIRRGGINK